MTTEPGIISEEERERIRSKMVKWKLNWHRDHPAAEKPQTPEEWLADPKNRDLSGVKLPARAMKIIQGSN